jgi:hypothetical protein
VTVDVPFPLRPPTPFWDPKGPMGGSLRGLGDVTPLATVNTALQDATAAYIATVNAPPLGPNGLPLVYNAQTGQWTAQGSVSGSSGGMIVLLLIGAAVFFMGRR